MSGSHPRRNQILLVGVGGQGVLAAAQILGGAAHAANLPVVVGQLHGMSQRGGSVQCTVILGAAEGSFLCGHAADTVIAFEPLEALRALPQMGPSTRLVTSRSLLVPFEAVLASTALPDVNRIVEQLGQVTREVHALDTRTLMESVGDSRALNLLMVGAAVGLGFLPIPEPALLGAAYARCGSKHMKANRQAFLLGRDAFRAVQTSGEDERVGA